MIQAANVMLLSTDGKLILQQRDDKPGILGRGQITAFGGSCEAGETPAQTAKRELKEELDLKVQDDDLTFWKVFHKTKTEYSEDAEVNLFILNQPLHPKKLTVFEGRGYFLVAPGDDLTSINFTKAARQFVADFFKEHPSHG